MPTHARDYGLALAPKLDRTTGALAVRYPLSSAEVSMRTMFTHTLMIAVLLAVTDGFVSIASAQPCLGIDACLLSPNRADAQQPISVNGCSVPPQFGVVGQFWATVFTPACNQHDTDWATFKPDVAAWFAQSNAAFYANRLAICQTRADIPAAQCQEAANIFLFAVSSTDIAQEIYKRGQYFASSCACRQLPAAPANLVAQVSSGPFGAEVTLQWTPGANATSYAVEVVQPALPPIDTGSPLPQFATAGVPNGLYQVQVRGLNPLGLSSPSNSIAVAVGTSGPCATPAAPSLPTTTFVNGVATVSWQAVAGATSYFVRAGLLSGGSELFSGNVGNTTAVSAGGLPPGFRAFVRVHAVNACGISGASPEATIGAVP
jgi:hypothetical protein